MVIISHKSKFIESYVINEKVDEQNFSDLQRFLKEENEIDDFKEHLTKKMNKTMEDYDLQNSSYKKSVNNHKYRMSKLNLKDKGHKKKMTKKLTLELRKSLIDGFKKK